MRVPLGVRYRSDERDTFKAHRSIGSPCPRHDRRGIGHRSPMTAAHGARRRFPQVGSGIACRHDLELLSRQAPISALRWASASIVRQMTFAR